MGAPLRLVKSSDEAADEAAKEAADEVYHAVMRTEMERAHIEAQDKAREASHAEYEKVCSETYKKLEKETE